LASRAVSISTGVWMARARKSRQKSMPCLPGNIQSSTIKS